MPPEWRDFCIFVKMRGSFLWIFVNGAAYETYPVKPKYESAEHFFVVTLPNVKRTGEETKTVNETVSDTAVRVLSCIRADIAVTLKGIGEAVGKSRATVARALAELKEKGYIERVGSYKTDYWKVHFQEDQTRLCLFRSVYESENA